MRLRGTGPAIIVGAVVLGPGSMLAASRVGADHRYAMLWLVALAALLMIGMTALAARVGAVLEGTIGDELARRIGRLPTALVGLCVFGIVACFQFSNNIGVLAALQPLVALSEAARTAVIVALNLALVVCLFGFRRLYRPVERGMKLLVGLMLLAFAANLVLAAPAAADVAAGLWPRLPAMPLWPVHRDGQLIDPALPLVAMVSTTFSVAAAFYQAYLVRQKGWREEDVRRGLLDSVLGIGVLGFVTGMILVTAGAVLAGRTAGRELRSIADVAAVLAPLFGGGAQVLFCTGLLAGALSSFLVNAMIGGTVLSDTLGLGGDLDQRGPRVLTAVALLVGMGVALRVQQTGRSPLQLVLVAQALTAVGSPVLAAVLLWLGLRGVVGGRCPRWIAALAVVGLLVVTALGARVLARL